MLLRYQALFPTLILGSLLLLSTGAMAQSTVQAISRPVTLRTAALTPLIPTPTVQVISRAVTLRTAALTPLTPSPTVQVISRAVTLRTAALTPLTPSPTVQVISRAVTLRTAALTPFTPSPMVQAISRAVTLTTYQSQTPFQLLFTTQPSDTLADALMSPPVTVAAADATGKTLNYSVTPVTLSALPAGGGAAIPLGTVNCVNGVATYAGIELTIAGSYTLQAAATGFSPVSSNPFTIMPAPPIITSFTPTSGGAGTVVTITGTYFTGATAVAFGGTGAASYNVVNDTTINATVGTGATGTISVTTPGGMTTSSTNFTFYSSSIHAAAQNYTTDAGIPFTTTAANGLLNGATGNNLTAVIVTQPAHGTLSNVNGATGVFTYTPANSSYTGTDTFSYTVTDGVNISARATVTITINPLPSAAAQSYATDAGVAFTTSAANGLLYGATGNNLSAAIATQPAHGTLSNVTGATGIFTYTPANNSYSGTDTFTYTVTDGIGTSAPATVTITISALPSAAAQSYSTDGGVAFTTSAANGLLHGATGNNLTAAIATQPAHGTLSNVNGATGVFTYTPANNTYSGTDTFTYTVTDGIGTSAPATVTITINALPSAAAQAIAPTHGMAFTTTAANGLLTGATGNNLTAAIATQPKHGTLSNVNGASGVFTYTPANNSYSGTDTFSYTVTDGIGTSAPATVTITINALPTAAAHSYLTDRRRGFHHRHGERLAGRRHRQQPDGGHRHPAVAWSIEQCEQRHRRLHLHAGK